MLASHATTQPRNKSPSTAASTLQLAISFCPPSRPDTRCHASSIRVFQAIILARVWGEPLLAIAMPARYAHSIHARVCLSVTRLLSYSLSVTPHPIHEVGQGDRLSLQSLVFRIRPFEILGSVGRQALGAAKGVSASGRVCTKRVKYSTPFA